MLQMKYRSNSKAFTKSAGDAVDAGDHSPTYAREVMGVYIYIPTDGNIPRNPRIPRRWSDYKFGATA